MLNRFIVIMRDIQDQIEERFKPILDELLDEYNLKKLPKDFLKDMLEELSAIVDDVLAESDELC